MSGCYRSSEMDRPDRAEPAIESFIREEAHDLEDWRWLWEGDHPFPLESHRPGLAGRLVLAIKRALRPLVRAPQADLWDRQRAYNKVLLSHLEALYAGIGRVERSFDELGDDLQTVQAEILADLRGVQAELVKNQISLRERIEPLEDFKRKGMKDLMRHTDALFSRLDQKLDRSRRLVEQLRPGRDEG